VPRRQPIPNTVPMIVATTDSFLVTTRLVASALQYRALYDARATNRLL
jgi:hypothetical protein